MKHACETWIVAQTLLKPADQPFEDLPGVLYDAGSRQLG